MGRVKGDVLLKHSVTFFLNFQHVICRVLTVRDSSYVEMSG